MSDTVKTENSTEFQEQVPVCTFCQNFHMSPPLFQMTASLPGLSESVRPGFHFLVSYHFPLRFSVEFLAASYIFHKKTDADFTTLFPYLQ